MLSVSVAIPVFNEEKYLPTCLQAIRSQNYNKSYELLVIDNCSTDKSAKIAKEYGARVVKEPKKGMLFAKHRCFLEAKGKIVATTDADSIVPNNWLTSIINAYKKDREVIATTGLVDFTNSSPYKLNFAKLDQYVQKLIYSLIKQPITMRGPNRSIKREIYFKVNGIHVHGSLREDEFHLLPKLKKFGKVAFLPDLIVKTSNRRLKNHAWKYYLGHLFWGYLIKGSIAKIFNLKLKDYSVDYR